MRNRAWVLVAGVSALAACVSSPNYQPPNVVVAPAFQALSDTSARRVPASSARTADSVAPSPVAVPDSFSTSAVSDSSPAIDSVSDTVSTAESSPTRVSGEAPDSDFWSGLGDSTLTALVHEALRASPDVRAARARFFEARSSRRLASLDLAPQITAAASVARQQLSAAQFPGTAGALPRQDLWDAGVDASWELDLFGRVSHNVRAGRAFEESADDQVRDAQLTLAAEVARTYFELRGAQNELAVSERNAANQRRTMTLTEQRLSAGSGTAFDLERARAELSLTLAESPAIEARIAASRNQLAVLLGRAPEGLPESLLAAGSLPVLPNVVKVGSPATLVKRRPDVLSAERHLAAQTMLIGAAQADYLPRVSLAASAGYTAPTFNSIGNTGTPRFFVGPVLSWPFLDMGRVKTRVDIAQAQADQARAQYTSAVVGAIGETESAIVSYDRSRARLTNLSEAVRASTHALDLAQLRYEAGETDFLQVLDAQRTLLSAESQLAVGRTSAATALVSLYKAVGGAWPGSR
ncbi:MAG: efflux transporter outer membrane subunit [Gemmatimonadaceae bacterium]